MIPAIGIMIAAYICLRCIEIIARNGAMFASPANRRAVQVLAGLVLAVAVYCAAEVVMSASRATGALSPFTGR